LKKKVAKRFGDFKKSPYLCIVKQLKNNNNMAVQLTFNKTEEILSLDDVLWGDSSMRIEFKLSNNRKEIRIYANWIDNEFKTSAETDIAKLLCEKINKDAERAVVKFFTNCIEAKDSHVYFELFEFDNYATIKVYERKFKVDMVQ
jgi:hypothetical protein